jgi:hypothetical protein
LFVKAFYLKKWKKQWITLSRDGYLRCFNKENDLSPDQVLFIPHKVKVVKIGNEIENVTVPKDKSKEFLIKLITKDGTFWTFCANDVNEMM